ncbi:hypothetical protein Q4498_01735 [Neptunomonas phycophila]|uniref:hypothetical protein n=1 Tax=Neptunomonas phycophila TaxID=1572645 RepID=UPI0026E1865B|nr:hypothetical protein [Neptunomonas phycophila]MDO6466819.1 hypothetical protein [Neptunomonas phycophila]
MSNILQRFKALIPGAHNELVNITANNGDGTSSATTLGGAAITVKGESVSAGNRALIRNGEVVRQMPSLIAVEIEV